MATTIIGQRFYLYAAKAKPKRPIWSDDLRVATPLPPLWMIEPAEQVKLIEPGVILTDGVIVGSAVIDKLTPPDPPDPGALFHWHLVDVQRAKKLRKPKRHPQPVQFRRS